MCSLPYGSVAHTATLKDRGTLTPAGLERFEVETNINPETFTYYAGDASLAHLEKQRATLCDGVSVDWIEGCDYPLIEVEERAELGNPGEFLGIFSGDIACR